MATAHEGESIEASLARHDAYDQIEEEFNRVLDESLEPRGPEMLYDVVAELGIPRGAAVLDVGCGVGRHSYELARRFGYFVTGVDPVLRRAEPDENGAEPGSVQFAEGTADSLPAPDASVDLIWCRDVLTLVPDLAAAFREFARVLKPGAKAVTYLMFATERLEPGEAAWLHPTMGGIAQNADPEFFEAAVRAGGLNIEQCIVLSSEWGEFDQENTGKPARKLLQAARLLREPERYIARFGQENYDIALGDCLWHVYRLLGKMSGRIYVLSKG